MSNRSYGAGEVETVREGGKTAFKIRWRDANGRRRQRIVYGDRRTAERILATLISDRDLAVMGLKSESANDIRFDELAEKYRADLATRVKPRQVECIRAHLERLKKALGNPRVRDISKDGVSTYRQRRLDQGRANATVNLEVGSLRAMCRFGVRMDLILRNPIEGLPPLPQGKAFEKKPRRPFDEDELRALFNAAEALDQERRAHMAAETTINGGTKSKAWNAVERPIYIPQTPLFRAFAYTGGRYGEVVQTTWGDWSERSRTLTLRAETTKSKKSRRIPLHSVVEADLRALRDLHTLGYGRPPKPVEPIFLSPTGHELTDARENATRFLNDALKRAGIEKVCKKRGRLTIHSLRHSFASMLARAGAGLTQAQALLGHSTPELTAVVYTHHDDADLRKAVDKIA